ncbi:hypothetical protein GGX14DRAFT_381097 [Mycena pura]|uniref:Uncharacterized protein n=1 Tax=Mycena pura TaxID=153505 RepID=A0AAD6UP39_9AGAR|nr:hypothetical protein GGX14DRAFT_381097 [Mycena pura]
MVPHGNEPVPRPEPPPTPPPAPEAPAATPEPSRPPERRWLRTDRNPQGVYKVFPRHPSRDPEETITLEDLCRAPELATPAKVQGDENPPWYPFLNPSVARLMCWHHLTPNLQGKDALNELVHDIFLNPETEHEHFHRFDAGRELQRLDDLANTSPGEPPNGWTAGSVQLKLPSRKYPCLETEAPVFDITGILFRPLLDTLHEALQSPLFEQFHLTPYSLRWDPDYDPRHPDVYSSSAMLKAYSEISKHSTPEMEAIVVAFMFFSDSTNLAQFGHASMWPLYTHFGNISKYTRAKPTAHASFHQAYFPTVCLERHWYSSLIESFMQLPDELKDTFLEVCGENISPEVLTHLKRELMHTIWDLLLSDAFVDAYKNGIEIKCYDGIGRLVFPRIFVYGADYPEKYVSIASLCMYASDLLQGSPCHYQKYRGSAMSALRNQEG